MIELRLGSPATLGSLGRELRPLAGTEICGSRVAALESSEATEGHGGGVLGALGLVLEPWSLTGRFVDDLESDLVEVATALSWHGRSIARVSR